MNVMIFLLGGCAGWAVRSLIVAYKRRKMASEITTIISKAVESLQDMISGDDNDISEPIDVTDRLKVVSENENPSEK